MTGRWSAVNYGPWWRPSQMSRVGETLINQKSRNAKSCSFITRTFHFNAQVLLIIVTKGIFFQTSVFECSLKIELNIVYSLKIGPMRFNLVYRENGRWCLSRNSTFIWPLWPILNAWMFGAVVLHYFSVRHSAKCMVTFIVTQIILSILLP